MRVAVHCLFLAGGLLLLPGPAGAQSPRDASWPQAISLTRKLEAIEKRRKEPRPRPETILVTEGELNSYLTLSMGPKMPPGITGVQVRLQRERVSAVGYVDLDRWGDTVKSSSSRFSLLALLSGQVPIELQARLPNNDGFGTLEWEQIRISSLPVPLRALEELVAALTRTPSQPGGFDIRAPFRLPYSARRIRLEPGRALLDF
jgi:hypothetical protein